MRTALVTGHFNVLHHGHIRLFKYAREYADRLIVGVESDELAGNAAFIPQDYRLEGVISNQYVDEAFLFDTSVCDVISSFEPDIVVKGKEHEYRFNVEEEALSSYGGILLFSSGYSGFSSSELMRFGVGVKADRSDFPDAYLERHDISRKRCLEIVDRFRDLKVIVLGDLIIDEYIACSPLGMSHEDPTLVVSPIESKKFVGGAGIVAAHAAGLGASTRYLGVVGDDDLSNFAKTQFQSLGVSSFLALDRGRPTTLKQRYRAQGKTLLRVSRLQQDSIPLALQDEFFDKVLEIIDDCDCLIFSDFNYGCLPQNLVDQIIVVAREKGVLMTADSQSSSQIGDIARFRKMDLITPTEREARVSLKNQEDGLVILAEKLRTAAEAKHIILKMGQDGLLVQTSLSNEDGIYTDQVDALNTAPKDVAGAGDSVLISASLAMAAGANIWEMGLIGSVAAAIQVGRVGNLPLSDRELKVEFDI